MKQFVRKTIIFILILVVVVQVFKLLVPYWWGNQYFHAKINQIRASQENYNTFFFGSSRIYRHINPEIFDKVVNRNSSADIKSYNMGTPATFNPEIYHLFENFIRSPYAQPRYIFIELQQIDRMPESIIHSSRKKYWVNLKEYFFAVRWFAQAQSLSIRHRLYCIRKYSVAFIENALGIGELSDMLAYFESNDGLVVGRKGYFPLEVETEEFAAEELVKRRDAFLADNTAIAKRRIQIKHIFNSIEPDSPQCTKVHINRINRILQFGERNGIHIIFMLTNGGLDEDTLATFYNIPAKHRLNLADPNKYPEFYQEEYYYDKGHFTLEGSRRFSNEAARNTLKLL